MDIKSLLYSLLPLILIAVFSWLFSALAAKGRKQDETDEQFTLAEEPNRRPLQEIPEEVGAPGAGPFENRHRVPDMTATDYGDYTQYQESRRQAEMSKPIKPKWWGA